MSDKQLFSILILSLCLFSTNVLANEINLSLSLDKNTYNVGETQQISIAISGEQSVDAYLAVVNSNGSFMCLTLSGTFENENVVQPIVSNWISVSGTYPLNVSLNNLVAGQYTWYCIFTASGNTPLDTNNWIAYNTLSFSIQSSTSDQSYTDTYYTRLGPDPQMRLSLTQTGSSITWSMTGFVEMSGTGSLDSNVVTISATSPFSFSATLTFSDTSNFQGTWIVADEYDSSNGTITGSKNPWTTYDYDTLGIPKFVNTDYIQLSKIDRISYFRSGEGHDYSDEFESCRSMKHYFVPESNIDPTTITITSPVNGKIVGLTNEWAGVQIGIESTDYPGITFIMFHVDLIETYSLGDTVQAGDVLGSHIGSQTNSDMAVGILTPSGYRYVSYLETLTDSLFANYQSRGMSQRSDAIHSKEARDADPLSCEGERFTSTGSLPGWFQFN